MKIKHLLLLLFTANAFAATVVDEHIQWEDTNGKPIVNGYIYIGEQNQNPVTNPITIYSDRDLGTPISNPQRTDSYGRSVNKIWMPGRYSIRVDNSNNVQKFIDLDRGEDAPTGTTKLSNVQGANTITAEGAGTLVDGQIYIFKAAQANTDEPTLNPDSLGATSIVSAPGVPVGAGAIQAGQFVEVVYQETNDEFQMLNPSSGVGSADAGAASAPTERSYRDSASPATNDLLGEKRFDGNDAAGNRTTYARLFAKIDTTTNGGESGRLHAGEIKSGSEVTRDILSYPPNYLSGGNVTINSSDSDHDVDIAEIHFRNSDDDLNFDTTSTFTKQLDATFAAGTDAGGMASGESLPTSGTIYLYAITNDSTGAEDFIADTSATGANIDAGWSIQETHAYTTEPYIAKISTDGSANIEYISFRKQEWITEIPIATTSGTTADFTGLLENAEQIEILLTDVSTDGTEELLGQIGDSGGLEASGYVSDASALAGATATNNATAGFILDANHTSSYAQNGRIVLTNLTGNLWVCDSVFGRGTGGVMISGGRKTLSGTLDRFTLTSTNTPDTFDGGLITVKQRVRP